MAWPVVAVDAIHPADIELFELVGRQRYRAIEIFGNPALPVLDPDPGNFLPLRIAGAVPHLVADVHVPMDARGNTRGGTAAAGAKQASDLTHAIFFIVAEPCNNL